MAGGGGEDNPVGINVTAMVDIIFCLCLFFMCSLKFRELDGKMDSWLPKDKGGKPSSAVNVPVDEIRILLSYDPKTQVLQRVFVNRPIPQGEEGTRLLQSLIREQYDSYRKLGKADVPVIIDSGKRVPWEFVIEVMNMARGENIQKVEFAFGSVHKGEEEEMGG